MTRMSTECRDEPGGMSCRGGRLSYGKGKSLEVKGTGFGAK